MKETQPLAPQYLRVTNYERFQHYKDRRPVWIKLYVDLLDDYELKKQKPATRLLAMLFLLLAAKQDNRVPHDPDWIASELALSVGSVAAGIETLVSIGFLSVASRYHSASKTLAKRSGSASPEKRQRQRKREEEEKEKIKGLSLIRETINESLREAS